MAYYLTVEKNNEHQKLNLTLLKEFKRLTRFKNTSCSLEEIDNCTSLFEDEIAFKKALTNKGIIDFEDITRELSIRYLRNGNLEKVTYGLVYKEQVKYLDLEYLRMKILSLQNDKTFLEKLVTKYRNSYCNNITISYIRNCLENEYYKDKYIYNILNNFVSNEVYSVERSTGVASLKYKSLHDLAMFVYNYEYKKKINEVGSSLTIENNNKKKKLLELQKSILITKSGSKMECNNVRKKVLKKSQLEGQISIFD